MEKFGGVHGSALGSCLCSLGTRSVRSPVAQAEGSGACLQLAAREAFDRGRGGRVDPEPEPGRHLSVQSLVSGWQERRTARFLLFVRLSFVPGGKKLARVIKEECPTRSPCTQGRSLAP